ncbi:MAG: TolC family protein [Verrucomicrobiota bacterium]
MRRCVFPAVVGLALVTFFHVHVWASAKPMVLDLNGCYLRALVQSETLAVGGESIRQAEAQYWQALSAVLPEVNLVARQRLQNRDGNGFVGGNGDDNFNNGGGGDRIDRFDAQVRVRQTIFSGFRDYQLLGAIRAEERATRADLVRDRQTLFLDVSDLYFQILSQRRDLEVLADLNLALSDRVAELDQRVKLGRSRKSEWLAARTTLAENQVNLEAGRGLLAASRELMAFLLGRPAQTFVLEESNAGGTGNNEALATYLTKVGQRPDLAAGEERVTASERQVSSQRAAFWPTVDFQFNWLALEEPERDDEWNLFFTATLPVFDGGLRAAELSESKSLARSSRLTLERLRRLAEYDVRLAYSNFKANAAQLIRLKEALRISHENFIAQSEDYELGRASNLDVLNALVRKEEVRRRFAEAGYQIQTDLNALHVAAGEIPPERPSP